jgi:Bacterial CdiA-CT RNAse A domain
MSVVLTPAQLQAVLNGIPISDGEVVSNRLWGGLRVLGGSLEMVGAAGLLLAPEPTMATKVGGAALGIHGSDTISTGMRQVWTGQPQRTLTEQGGTALARKAGASPKTAEAVGVGVDIAVPLAVSIGVSAARIAAIRSTGRISLIEHEAVAGVGGHTIARHVGKTEAELRARLVAQANVPVASSFASLEVAERVLFKVLQSNRVAIEAWARTATANVKFVTTYIANEEIGYGVVRATGQLERMSKVKLVLKFQSYHGKPYYILTAFPTP